MFKTNFQKSNPLQGYSHIFSSKRNLNTSIWALVILMLMFSCNQDMLTKDVSDVQLISLTVDLHSLEQQLERLEETYVTLANHSGTESVSDIAFSNEIKAPLADIRNELRALTLRFATIDQEGLSGFQNKLEQITYQADLLTTKVASENSPATLGTKAPIPIRSQYNVVAIFSDTYDADNAGAGFRLRNVNLGTLETEAISKSNSIIKLGDCESKTIGFRTDTYGEREDFDKLHLYYWAVSGTKLNLRLLSSNEKRDWTYTKSIKNGNKWVRLEVPLRAFSGTPDVDELRGLTLDVDGGDGCEVYLDELYLFAGSITQVPVGGSDEDQEIVIEVKEEKQESEQETQQEEEIVIEVKEETQESQQETQQEEEIVIEVKEETQESQQETQQEEEQEIVIEVKEETQESQQETQQEEEQEIVIEVKEETQESQQETQQEEEQESEQEEEQQLTIEEEPVIEFIPQEKEKFPTSAQTQQPGTLTLSLDANGVTVKATLTGNQNPNPHYGTTPELDGVEYEIVNRERLIEMISKDQDISKVCTTFVEDMSSLFAQDNYTTRVSANVFANNLQDYFNKDISSWDTSSVRDMNAMFLDAVKFNQDISKWDVSNVGSMAYMFSGALSFQGDISGWDVSSVENMDRMFASHYYFGFDTYAGFASWDISEWDVSSVTNMDYMFAEATYFNQDISEWDVSSVESMQGMFETATSFNQNISKWDVSSVTLCLGFSAYTLSGWTTAEKPRLASSCLQ